MEDNKIKLARQAVDSHKAKLSTTANKDQVRRQIKAAEERLHGLESRQGSFGQGAVVDRHEPVREE